MPYKDPAKRQECARVSAARSRQANPQKHYAAERKWRRNHRAEWLAARLRRKYGLTPVHFAALLVRQGRRCAMPDCATMLEYVSGPLGEKRNFVVDHDHTTGKVRGLLCNPCNIHLGYYEKSLSRVGTFVSYLSSPPGIPSGD